MDGDASNAPQHNTTTPLQAATANDNEHMRRGATITADTGEHDERRQRRSNTTNKWSARSVRWQYRRTVDDDPAKAAKRDESRNIDKQERRTTTRRRSATRRGGSTDEHATDTTQPLRRRRQLLDYARVHFPTRRRHRDSTASRRTNYAGNQRSDAMMFVETDRPPSDLTDVFVAWDVFVCRRAHSQWAPETDSLEVRCGTTSRTGARRVKEGADRGTPNWTIIDTNALADQIGEVSQRRRTRVPKAQQDILDKLMTMHGHATRARLRQKMWTKRRRMRRELA